MEKEKLKKYIELLDKQEIEYTKEEYQIKYTIERDSNLNEFVKSLQMCSTKNDRLALLDNYFKQKEFKGKNEEEKIKEVIKKEYGIDLTNIDHMKLQSGIDVIAFYDNNISRKRIIDYSYAKSLVNEFTDIQNKKIKFQSDDYEKNSNQIAEEEANKNSKRELNMIDINKAKSEYFDLINRIKNQDPTKIQCINQLINEAEKRNIKFINFENMIALDEDGNIIESFYNDKTERFEIETPKKIDSSVDNVDNKENIDKKVSELENDQVEEENIGAVNNIEVTPTNFENEEEIKDAEFLKELEDSINIYHINCSKEEAMKNVVKYSKDMSMLENDFNTNQITQDEYEFYKICTERYSNIMKQKLEKNKKKTLTYERGIISAIVISILAIIIGIVIFILTL